MTLCAECKNARGWRETDGGELICNRCHRERRDNSFHRKVTPMAQTRAKFSYRKAAWLRKQLQTAFVEAGGSDHAAQDRFHVDHHTRWVDNGNVEGRVPAEYSTMYVEETGEGGLSPTTIKALGEVGFGVVEESAESRHNVTVSRYGLSSYNDPSWSWANPARGLDPQRPSFVRDKDVKEFLADRPHEHRNDDEPYDPFQPVGRGIDA